MLSKKSNPFTQETKQSNNLQAHAFQTWKTQVKRPRLPVSLFAVNDFRYLGNCERDW